MAVRSVVGLSSFGTSAKQQLVLRGEIQRCAEHDGPLSLDIQRTDTRRLMEAIADVWSCVADDLSERFPIAV